MMLDVRVLDLGIWHRPCDNEHQLADLAWSSRHQDRLMECVISSLGESRNTIDQCRSLENCHCDRLLQINHQCVKSRCLYVEYW
jgi:hypothetical protein